MVRDWRSWSIAELTSLWISQSPKVSGIRITVYTHGALSYFLLSSSCCWKWPGLYLSSWSWSPFGWATHPMNNMNVSIWASCLRLSIDKRNPGHRHGLTLTSPETLTLGNTVIGLERKAGLSIFGSPELRKLFSVLGNGDNSNYNNSQCLFHTF